MTNTKLATFIFKFRVRRSNGSKPNDKAMGGQYGSMMANGGEQATACNGSPFMTCWTTLSLFQDQFDCQKFHVPSHTLPAEEASRDDSIFPKILQLEAFECLEISLKKVLANAFALLGIPFHHIACGQTEKPHTAASSFP